MRVNSVITCFLNNHFSAGRCVATVMFAIFITASSFEEGTGPSLREKQVNLLIREIGHRLLLQAADSTSRVLPVTSNQDGTFLLRFEKEFVFNHDSLMVLSEDLLPKTVFPSGYTVTVHDCSKGNIVYGFQVSNTSADIRACSGRRQPRGCYTIEFAFPDFTKKADEKKAAITLVTESAKSDRQQVNPESKEVTSKKFDYDNSQKIEELKSVTVDRKQDSSTPAALTKATFDYSLINVIAIGVLVVLAVTLMIVRFGKNLNVVPVENNPQAIVESSNEELAPLGKFLFSVKDQRLLLGNQVISLTDKECKVLDLLNQNFGELIRRETLMQKVWIDEGVITGRSLDMFISKLRKKLSSDPDVSITNVHGKGYKLEIPGIQAL